MSTDDKFDQRLEDLRERVIRAVEKNQKTSRIKAKRSRLNLPIWILALSTFCGALGYMQYRMLLDRFGSIVIAALAAGFVLLFMQLVASLGIMRRKEAR